MKVCLLFRSATRWLPPVILLLGLSVPAWSTNTPPVALADSIESTGRSFVVDPLANDRDIDGQHLTVSYQGGTCAGSVAVDDGLLVFTPSHPRPQQCLIHYQISDGAATDSATVTVTLLELPLFFDSFESGDTSEWD